MNLKIVPSAQIASGVFNTKFGQVYEISGAKLFQGHYLIKDGNIPASAIHEFATDSQWFKKWLSFSGQTFGGPNDDDFIISNECEIKSRFVPNVEEKLEGKVFLFQYTWDFNYHHFLISAVPRLSGLTAFSTDEVRVLVRSDTPEYQKDFIKEVCIGYEIVYVDPDKSYVCEDICLMNFMSEDANRICKFFDHFIKQYHSSSQLLDIFVSRKDSAQKRPLLNEGELSKLANQYGFTELVLSQYSIHEKMEYFGRARNILTTFGAGVANIVFCQQCEKLIFIEHPVYNFIKVYQDICELKNIKVHIIKTRTVRWFLLIALYKLLGRFGVRKHEWSNPYYWKFPINRVITILNKKG